MSYSACIVLLIIASVYFCRDSLVKVANKYCRNSAPISLLAISNIFQFMIGKFDGGKKRRARGILWRIVLFYLFLLLCAFIGLMNCIPSVNQYFDRKSRICSQS